MRRGRIIIVVSFASCFILGAAFGRYTVGAWRDHLGVSFSTLIKSPIAYWRFRQRDWNSLDRFHPERDQVAAKFQQNRETILLPLTMTGERLSDAFAVTKMGGAISMIGRTVIILDRLGGDV
jgi:hypothetical protein